MGQKIYRTSLNPAMLMKHVHPLPVCVAIATLLLSSCGSWHTEPRAPLVSPPDARRPVDFAEATGSQPMTGTNLKFYDTGPEIRKTMLALIASANDYILIDSFLVSNDPVANEVLQALARKHRSGVRIHLLVDSSSRYMPQGKKIFESLEAMGIPSVEFNPLQVHKLLVAPVMLPRDHRKFWIVDGSILLLGGANITGTSLRSSEENGNRDFMVKIESPEAIKAMVGSFVASWNRYADRKLRPEEFSVPPRCTGTNRFWLVDQNADVEQTGTISKMFAGLLAMATEEVWLVQSYTFVTPGILARIRETTARGVEVNVMFSEHVHALRFHYASHYGIKDLLDAGAKVWIWNPGRGLLHAKAVVVDRRWAAVGSANFNYRSFTLSRETNLVFHDPDAVRRVVDIIEDFRKDCRPVGPEEAKRYRTPAYYFNWLWMQLAG